MDPALTEVTQLFGRFKAAFLRNDFGTCSSLLAQLKVDRSCFSLKFGFLTSVLFLGFGIAIYIYFFNPSLIGVFSASVLDFRSFKLKF